MMLFGIMLPSFTLNIERWRWNEEFQLWVSNQGHFKDKKGKVVPIKIDPNRGYCKVNFHFAHRVVAMTWIPCDNPKDMTVDHLNHNKRDNSVKNLEWVTKEENARRAIEDLCNVSDVSKAQMVASLQHKKELPYNVCYTAKSGEVETYSSYEDAAAFVFYNFGHAEKAETIITKIKKKMVNGGKVYGGYWTKETCA